MVSPQTVFGLGDIISRAAICFPSLQLLFIYNDVFTKVHLSKLNGQLEWTFGIFEPRLCSNCRADRFYKINDTYQYKCGGVKAHKKGKGFASACCPSVKSAAQLYMWQRKRHAFRPM